jgi:hypothetical protein
VNHNPGDYTCVEPVNRFLNLMQGKKTENCSPAGLGADVVALLDGASISATTGKVEVISSAQQV